MTDDREGLPAEKTTLDPQVMQEIVVSMLGALQAQVAQLEEEIRGLREEVSVPPERGLDP